MVKRFGIIDIFLLLSMASVAFSEGIWKPVHSQLQLPNRRLDFWDIHFTDAHNGWVVGRHHQLAKDGQPGVILHGHVLTGFIMHYDGNLWVIQHSSSEISFFRVFFVTKDTGWVIGRTGISDDFRHGKESVILVTHDGGAEWKEQNKLPWMLTDIHFVNEDEGWAVGSDVDGNMTVLLHTKDGGNNWIPEYQGRNEALWSIFFVDENHGWVTGGSIRKRWSYFVLRTEDGGKHWMRIPMPMGLDEWMRLSRIFFINAEEGWAIGNYRELPSRGVILHTTDRGNTWSIQKREIEGFVNYLWFIDRKEGWVAGENQIFHTQDGGITWSIQKKIEEPFFRPNGICFVDAKTGWVAGMVGVILQTSDGGETWDAVYQRSFPEIDLNAVYFPNSIDGWIVGEQASIFHTNDNGITWTLQKNPTSVELLGTHFINAQEGWIVGEQGVILHTKNCGVTWERQHSGTNKQLNSVFFVSEKEGCIVGGKPGRENGIILRTFDGGERWKTVKTVERWWLGDVQFLNAQKGWAVGLRSILHTEDGGKSWQEQQCDELSIGYAVYFIDERTGWIAGVDSSGAGIIAHTVDGGSEWVIEYPDAGSRTRLRDVFFANQKEGWVITEGGNVLHTTDGGTTWTSQTTDFGFNPPSRLRTLCYGGDKTLWAVGDEGVCLKYFDPSLRVIPPFYWAVEQSGKDIFSWGNLKKRKQRSLPSDSPLTNQLYQNYPNPFNPETFLPYQLAQDSEVTIRIYDVKGQLVRKLFLGKKQAGLYKNKQRAARWDGRDSSGTAVPSGVYFYTLTAGEYTATRKLLLLK